MPNWCSNTLRVTGPGADVLRFKLQAVGLSPWDGAGEENILNFHSLVPAPPKVLAAGYDQTGYHWERANWGCKWGACQAQLVDEWEGMLIYSFDTAWSPPVPFLEKLAPKWPTLTFLLDYEETGMGFKGIARVAGNSVEDHCLEL